MITPFPNQTNMSEKPSSGDSWQESPGFVYFIAAGKYDPPVAVKIGISKNSGLLNRFANIKSSNHEPIRFIGFKRFPTMEAAKKHEEMLHKKFKKIQCKGAGSEWFHAKQELMDYIEKNTIKRLELGVPDSDEIWSDLQNNMGEYGYQAVKTLHDALLASGYISVKRGITTKTLQLRLSKKPNEPVIVMHPNADEKEIYLEIYLVHSENILIKKLMQQHVTLDNVQTKLKKKHPQFRLNQWAKPPHDREFLTAFKQVAKRDPSA